MPNVLLFGNTVYKVFDYRNRGVVEGKRMLEANLKFLPGAELVYGSLSVYSRLPFSVHLCSTESSAKECH